MERDQFTLEEANALVPWLEERFERLAPGREEYLALQGRLNELLQQRKDSGAPGIGGPNVNEELSLAQESVAELTRQIEDGVEEILDRGIIVRSVEQGLVDFPSQREGREVYLCWIRGETRIDFWHETDQGFVHRQAF
jgi:hypothetical protein